MQTLIFGTVAPYITDLMLMFSVFLLLSCHNEPGAGFTGGLIVASASPSTALPLACLPFAALSTFIPWRLPVSDCSPWLLPNCHRFCSACLS